jgi:hypothetical protein
VLPRFFLRWFSAMAIVEEILQRLRIIIWHLGRMGKGGY